MTQGTTPVPYSGLDNAWDTRLPDPTAKQYATLRVQSGADLTLQAMVKGALAKQVGGDHYKKMVIQPMTYSMKNGLDACQHTIIKYVTRFRDKDGVADLRKAIHCIEMLIEFEEEKNART